MKYLCVGQAIYDITLPIEEKLRENIKIGINNKYECGGGSATNCAHLLSLWGSDTYFAGVVGNDYYGHLIEKEFKAAKVNLKYLEFNNELETGCSYIISNMIDATRTIISRRDKVIHKSDNQLDQDFDVLILDGYEVEFSLNAIKKNQQAIKILDAGKVKDGIMMLGNYVDYFICSHEFASDFSNIEIDYKDINTLIDCYNCLYERFKTNIIITLEDKGCFIKTDQYYKIIPTIKVNAIDTCGAGDIFHGAFAYFIANNYIMEEAATLANITASLSTTKVGRCNSIFPLNDVLKVYNDVFKK